VPDYILTVFGAAVIGLLQFKR